MFDDVAFDSVAFDTGEEFQAIVAGYRRWFLENQPTYTPDDDDVLIMAWALLNDG